MGRVYNDMNEFNANLKMAMDGIIPAIGDNIQTLAETMADAIKKRVQYTGKAYDDTPFSSYSSSHAYKKKKYGKGRAGTRTDIKNFTYQGTMWEGFGYKRKIISSTNVIGKISFAGDNVYMSNEELHDKHSLREGKDIAQPTDKMQEDLVEQITRLIAIHITKILG